jgi:ABC-type uncharacterized transport system involved in gliding motility auxiliary subunit
MKNRTILAWSLVGFFALALLFNRAVYPELMNMTIALGVLLAAALGFLIHENRKGLRSRSGAFGLNSAVTILLVVALLGVANFLAVRYPYKVDLTKNKAHSLSEQTVKVVKGLKDPVKATLFAQPGQREQFRPLLENYRGLNPKFEFEYVDPYREPTRTAQAGIKKLGTLQVTTGTREQKIEDANEEKLTNALIKLLKEKTNTLCAVTGHGEKSFEASEAEGYSNAKKSLVDQSFAVKDVNLVRDQKTLEGCDAIAIIGPTRSFFPAEAKILQEYLANGGRAVIALDLDVKGKGEYAPELMPILAQWHVKSDAAMVIDRVSQNFGMDASVPLLITYSKDNPITKDFAQTPSYFPLMRPVDVIQGPPPGMNVQWLAQSTPKAFAVADLKALASGAVSEKGQKAGPFNAAVAVEGKLRDSKAARNTRLVVFGTSFFATNNYARYGLNADFFQNAVAWALEDESVISIRAKEEGAGRVELSQKQGMVIFLLTVVLIPLAVAIAGIVIWVLRRKW